MGTCFVEKTAIQNTRTDTLGKCADEEDQDVHVQVLSSYAAKC